jgi:hypothetical protein
MSLNFDKVGRTLAKVEGGKNNNKIISINTDDDEKIKKSFTKLKITDSGKFIMEHATEKPSYHQRVDHVTYGYQYAITATLTETDYTYWKLKYD